MTCPSGSGNSAQGCAMTPLSQPEQSSFRLSNTLKSQRVNKTKQAFRRSTWTYESLSGGSCRPRRDQPGPSC